MKIGPKILKARTERGMTQAQLANLLGVVKSEISQYEKDKKAPKLKNLPLLANALGISLASLLEAVQVEQFKTKWALIEAPTDTVSIPCYNLVYNNRTKHGQLMFSSSIVTNCSGLLRGLYIWVVTANLVLKNIIANKCIRILIKQTEKPCMPGDVLLCLENGKYKFVEISRDEKTGLLLCHCGQEGIIPLGSFISVGKVTQIALDL